MERYCLRCTTTVEAEYEEPEMRKLALVWFCAGLPFLPFIPIIGADFAVMIPLTVLYIFGAGAAYRYWHQPALCTVCGAETPKPE